MPCMSYSVRRPGYYILRSEWRFDYAIPYHAHAHTPSDSDELDVRPVCFAIFFCHVYYWSNDVHAYGGATSNYMSNPGRQFTHPGHPPTSSPHQGGTHLLLSMLLNLLRQRPRPGRRLQAAATELPRRTGCPILNASIVVDRQVLSCPPCLSIALLPTNIPSRVTCGIFFSLSFV